MRYEVKWEYMTGNNKKRLSRRRAVRDSLFLFAIGVQIFWVWVRFCCGLFYAYIVK